MNSECAIVEKVGGTVNEFKLVYHFEARLLTLQIDGYHCASRVAKLLFRQLVIGIVWQSHVVYSLNLR